MSPSLDLSSLFGAALREMTKNRQEINALDGKNGNHGDNMVENLRLVTSALRSQRSQPPAKALQYASRKLQTQGKGGSSQYYAQGLQKAAQQLQGRSDLGNEDIATLAESLLGSLPQEGYPQQTQAGGSALDQLLGMAMQQQAQPESPAADILGQLLGAGAQQPAQAQDNRVDAGDVLSALLPAGMAFLQAKQAGADTGAAAGQALISALMSGQANPLQTGNPRTAAGGLIAQTLLQAALSRRR